jgi:hypothetical protein
MLIIASHFNPNQTRYEWEGTWKSCNIPHIYYYQKPGS